MSNIRKLVVVLIGALLAFPASAAILTFDFTARIDRPNDIFDVGTTLNGSFSYDSALTPTLTYPYGPGIQAEYHDPSIVVSFEILDESYTGSAFAFVADGVPGDDGMGLLQIGPDFVIGVYLSDPMGTAYSAMLPTGFPPLHQGPFPDANDDDDLTVPSGEFSFMI